MKYLLQLLLLINVSLLAACNDDEIGEVDPVMMDFITNQYKVGESESKEIIILFSGAASGDGVITVNVAADSDSDINTDYAVVPEPEGNILEIPFSSGDLSASFTVIVPDNSIADPSRQLTFTLLSGSGILKPGSIIETVVDIINDESEIGFALEADEISETKTEGISVEIEIEPGALADGKILVSLTSDPAVEYGTAFRTVPAAQDGIIQLDVSEGSEHAGFQVIPVDDLTVEDKALVFSINDADAIFSVTERNSFDLTILSDETGDDLTEFAFLKLPKGITKRDQFEWNDTDKTLTFLSDTHFSNRSDEDNDLEGFYWEVPALVRKVVIGTSVTIYGGFRTTGTLAIEGADRESSRIYGTTSKGWAHGPDGEPDPQTSCNNGAAGNDRAHDCAKWQYGAVSPTNFGSTYPITVKSVTIENARTYAITSFNNPLVVDDVYIVNTRPGSDYRSNSDGIGGGPGSVVTNTKIDTWDDAIKLYKDFTIRNVTIVHNANGAPFQLGWSSKPTTNHIIENVKIIASTSGPTQYNLAMISSSLTSGQVDATLNIRGRGLSADYTTIPGLEIRTGDPLPLVWHKSSGARVTLNLNDDSYLLLKAPESVMGDGTVTLENLCVDMLATEILCNPESDPVTGAPF